MELQTTHVELRSLIPSPGCFITQAGDVPTHERVISGKVYLGVNDSPDNWREITAAEAETIEAEKDAHDKAVEDEQRREAQGGGLD